MFGRDIKDSPISKNAPSILVYPSLIFESLNIENFDIMFFNIEVTMMKFC